MFEGQPKGLYALALANTRRTLWLLHNACDFHTLFAS